MKRILEIKNKSMEIPSIKIRNTTGMPSIKIPFNIASRNHYFDSHCILTVMIPEIMARAICCKKSFWINRNRSTCVFRLIGFPELAIKLESQWEFQLTTSEILGHHNQRWSRNFHYKFFLTIYLLKELTMLWRFYINKTGWVGITDYRSDTIFVISLKKNIFL